MQKNCWIKFKYQMFFLEKISLITFKTIYAQSFNMNNDYETSVNTAWIMILKD